MRRFILPVSLLLAVTACDDDPETLVAPESMATKAQLGEALYHDVNLSLNRTQSCATCHNPEHGFIDNRLGDDGLISPVSLGDDGTSIGDRNAPTAAYAAFSPAFEANGTRARHSKQRNHQTYEGPLGGQFHDGREPDLAGQAGGPPLNPIEMGMPDKAAVVDRLLERSDYQAAFKVHFGADIFGDVDAAYAAMAESIGAYEKTDEFAPFDSRYDRFLRGELLLTTKELTGRAVFFSQFANCAFCHQLHASGDPLKKFEETFTGYEYHNVGVPPNAAVRALNGAPADDGLLLNPAIDDGAHKGKYKVPTLRNVAVTEPYMHNGVFRDLRAVVLFYDHFVNADERPTNPETGEPWADPEVPETLSIDLLEASEPFTETEVEALVCFLRTLTDQRYEHLIRAKGIECAD